MVSGELANDEVRESDNRFGIVVEHTLCFMLCGQMD